MSRSTISAFQLFEMFPYEESARVYNTPGPSRITRAAPTMKAGSSFMQRRVPNESSMRNGLGRSRASDAGKYLSRIQNEIQ